MTTTAAKPRHTWIHPVGLLGVVLVVACRVTHSEALGGVAIVLLFAAGIGAVAEFASGRAASAPAAVPVSTAPDTLAGAWIRHGGRLVVVTADPDAPAPRRTVTVIGGDGHEEQLQVAVDAAGRVTEAARAGEPWTVAEAV